MGRVTSGDYDGDGRDEIAVLYDNGNCSVSLQVFDGSGSDSSLSVYVWEKEEGGSFRLKRDV